MKTNTTTGNAPLGEEKDTQRLDWLAEACYFPSDHPDDKICVLVPESAAPNGAFTCNSKNDKKVLRDCIDRAISKTSGKQEAVTESVDFENYARTAECIFDDPRLTREGKLTAVRMLFMEAITLSNPPSVPVAGAPVEQTDLGKPDAEADHVEAVLQKALFSCPWPEDVWTGGVATAGAVMRPLLGDRVTTSISGVLMRRGWELCIEHIQRLLSEHFNAKQPTPPLTPKPPLPLRSVEQEMWTGEDVGEFLQSSTLEFMLKDELRSIADAHNALDRLTQERDEIIRVLDEAGSATGDGRETYTLLTRVKHLVQAKDYFARETDKARAKLSSKPSASGAPKNQTLGGKEC